MSEILFDKYGGVEPLTPLVRNFIKNHGDSNLARYFINTDMEVLIKHGQFIAVVMGKPAAFYEGWTWNRHIKTLLYLIALLRTLLMF